jgi:transcriptional regulator with XRE-family HTH domain
MPQFDLARLAKAVREKRGDRSLRAIAPEVRVSFSTLSRVESGSYPDVVNLVLIFAWLQANPADYFILDNDHDPLSVQLRAMQGMSAETASALMDVIRAVYGQVLEQANSQRTP